jgi:hypothetical protein
LDNIETLKFFDEMVKKYKRWFRIEPEMIIHDLHPDYLSTKIAKKMKGKKIAVQHHIAHVVSCLGEHGVLDKAIGIAFDGTPKAGWSFRISSFARGRGKYNKTISYCACVSIQVAWLQCNAVWERA